MTETRRPLRGGDFRLLGMAAATALCIAGFLVVQLGVEADGRGGHRRIDVEAVQEKIRRGDLVRHEALWYHLEGAQD